MASSASLTARERMSSRAPTETTTTPSGSGSVRSQKLSTQMIKQLDPKMSSWACTPTTRTRPWSGCSGPPTCPRNFTSLVSCLSHCLSVLATSSGCRPSPSGSCSSSSVVRATSVAGSWVHSSATGSFSHSSTYPQWSSASSQASTSSPHSCSDGGPTSTTINTTTSCSPDQRFQPPDRYQSCIKSNDRISTLTITIKTF